MPTKAEDTRGTWAATATFPVPAALRGPGEHVLSVLVRPMAHDEDGGARDTHKAARGLTTAASIWLTAAVGAAAGAGLPLLAALGVVGYFVAVLTLPRVAAVLRRFAPNPWPVLAVHYVDGRGLLRTILGLVTQSGFHVTDLSTTYTGTDDHTDTRSVEVTVHLGGRGDIQELIASRLEELRTPVTLCG